MHAYVLRLSTMVLLQYFESIYAARKSDEWEAVGKAYANEQMWLLGPYRWTQRVKVDLSLQQTVFSHFCDFLNALLGCSLRVKLSRRI